MTKQEILNNLDRWTLQDNGSFATFGNLITGSREVSLNTRDEKEVRTAIIEKVKQNPQEWKIEKINIRYENGPWPYTERGTYFHNFFLIHQSAQLEFKKKGGKQEEVLTKMDYGKMHYYRGFSEQEWKELENLTKNSTWEIQKSNLEEKKSKITNPNSNKNNIPWGIILIGVIITMIVLFWRKIF